MIKVCKYLAVVVCLLSSASAAMSQQNLDDGNAAVLPTWQWRCHNGEASLNFNPAIVVDRDHTLVFDSIQFAGDYTMVVVYKPDTNAEATIWRLACGDGIERSLTTERIVSDSVGIRYADATTGIPIINTLRQTVTDGADSFASLTLGGGSLTGRVKIAEVMYFDRRLDNAALIRVQSALAVKYGVTLGPVDYVDGHGDVIWKFVNGMYHHRVTGVGRDSTYGINQLCSRSEMEDPLLTIRADSLAEGVFLICGDNDAPLTFEPVEDIELLNREWKINGNKIEEHLFSLTFDRRCYDGPTDSLVLLVDGEIYLPSAKTPGAVTYKNVSFPSDTCTFTLARGGRLWHMAMSSGADGVPYDGTHGTTVSNIYPNPTTGNYTIEVTGARWVTVNIYNAQGVLMESFSDGKRQRYLFNGSLPSGNSYYATVTTDGGTQTMKLIVK